MTIPPAQPIRGCGVGLVYTVYWLLSSAVAQTLESTFAAIGEAATFGLYGVVTALALGFAWACVPETRGVALEAVGRPMPPGSRATE